MTSEGKAAEGISRWPASERPRERMLARGPTGLSDAELLALVIGGTSRGRGGAVSTCRQLIGRLGGLRELAEATIAELRQIPGIGQARACALLAAAEIGRRSLVTVDRGAPLNSSQRVFNLVGARLGGLRQETFVVLALDARHRLLGEHQVALGTATSVEVHPRDVFAPLIRERAAAGIAAHNHPSGNPEPSDEDLALTIRLARAAEIIGIPLLDHVVVGQGRRYVSFADRGLL